MSKCFGPAEQHAKLDLMAKVMASEILAGRNVLVGSDYDGTGAAFADNPDSAIPHPRFGRSMTNFARTPGVHAFILSGRALDFMEGRFLPETSITLYCSYGLEVRDGETVWQHPAIADGDLVKAEFVQAVQELLPDATTDVDQARETDAPYIEIKSAAIVIHTAAAMGSNVDSNVERRIKEVTPELQRRFEGRLTFHDNSGNVEFTIPTPERVDKGTVIDGLGDGVVVYCCDDVRDVAAAQAVKAKGGFVIVVQNLPEPDKGRAGTPDELVEVADVVLGSTSELGTFLDCLHRAVVQELRANGRQLQTFGEIVPC